LKKKKKENFINNLKKTELADKLAKKNLHIKFSKKDINKVLRSKTNKNRLLPFSNFIELFQNILLNNKFKPWFTVKKGLALLDDWRFAIYKKLAIIESLKQKESLLEKDKNYLKYSLIFSETNITKASFILNNIWKIFHKDLEYDAVTTSPIKSIIWNLFFWVVLIFFNLLVVYWWLLETNTIWYKIFIDPLKGANSLDVFVINLLYWTYFIDNTFVQTLAILKSFYFLWFLVATGYLLFALVLTFLSDYRIRKIDKLKNESAFLTLLRMKIKQLEIVWWFWQDKNKRIFLYKNFVELIKGSILYGLEKKYINQDFTDDFLQLLTLYLAYRKFPQNTKLTEWFQNLMKMILDSYYSMLNWTNTNFDLSVVDNWIVTYQEEVEDLQWEKQYKKAWSIFAITWSMITSITIILMLFLSLQQWQVIEKLIKLNME